MAKQASDSDFAGIEKDGAKDFPALFDSLEKIVGDLRGVWVSHEQQGSPPGGNKVGTWYLALGSLTKYYRITISAGVLAIDYNEALSDSSPSWVNRLKVGSSTNEIQAILKALGDIDANSNSIINVSDIDGIDLASHSSRHSPGGADGLPVGAPVGIKTANAEGVSSSFARADHEHQGLLRWLISGAGAKYGDLNLVPGDGVGVTNPSGNDAKLEAHVGRIVQAIEADSKTIDNVGVVPDELSNVTIPNADGSKRFKVRVGIQTEDPGSDRDLDIEVLVGSNGDGTDPRQFKVSQRIRSGGETWIYFERLLPSAPASGDKLTLKLTLGAGTVDILGDDDAEDMASFLEIEEVTSVS